MFGSLASMSGYFVFGSSLADAVSRAGCEDFGLCGNSSVLGASSSLDLSFFFWGHHQLLACEDLLQQCLRLNRESFGEQMFMLRDEVHVMCGTGALPQAGKCGDFKVLGYAKIQKNTIWNFCVSAEHRNRSIGTRMMDKMCAWIRTNRPGCTGSLLYVLKDNSAALRFYSRLGFAEVPAAPRISVRHLMMEKRH